MLDTRPETRTGSPAEPAGPQPPTRTGKRPLRALTVLVVALVVVVGGLLTWGAYGDWHSQQPQTF